MVYPGRNNPDRGESLGRVLGTGIMIPTMLASCVLVGCALGYYGDKYFGSSPWLLLFGLLMGSIAGVREMMKLLKKMQKDEKR